MSSTYCHNHYYNQNPTLIHPSNIRKNDLTNEEIITFKQVYKNNVTKDIDAGLILIKNH